MHKYIIIGADGQLGTDLVRTFRGRGELVPLTIRDLDVCDHPAARRLLTETAPSHVISTAAYHRVDECEDHRQKAFEVNEAANANLAQICNGIGAIFAFFSTDYVFSGRERTPRTETDPAEPVSVYGASKLAGELAVRKAGARHMIFRTSGLYGAAGCMGKGYNFVESILSLARQGKPIKVVNDQVLTPTYALELANKIWEVLETGETGLFHCTNNGECSWYDFAKEIFRQTGIKTDLSPQTTEELGAKAKRPAYSVLTNERLKQLGLDTMRPWQEALTGYLKEKGHIT